MIFETPSLGRTAYLIGEVKALAWAIPVLEAAYDDLVRLWKVIEEEAAKCPRP
jgi:hypothetical protein